MKNIVDLLMQDNIDDVSLIKSIICNYSSIEKFDEDIIKFFNFDVTIHNLSNILHNLKDLSLMKSFDYFRYEVIKNPSKYITYSDFHSTEIDILRTIEKNSTRDEFLQFLNNLGNTKGKELYLRHEYVISYYDGSKDINKYFPEIKKEYIDFILNSVVEQCSFYSLNRAVEELVRIEEKELAIKLINDNLVNCIENYYENEKINIYKGSSFKNYLIRFNMELNNLANKSDFLIPFEESIKFIKDLTMKNNIPKNEIEIAIFTKEFGNNKYAMLQ